MRPLRILHVTPYFADAWAYGGIPRVASALAQGLAERGHEVTVCATDACSESTRLARPNRGSRFRPWLPALTAAGVVVRVFPNLSNRLAYQQLFAPLGLGEYLKRSAGAFDVAHLHACRNLPGAIAARHLRRAGVPYVLAPNGTALRIERRRLAKRVFDIAAGSRVLGDAARVIAVSDAERAQLRSIGVAASAIRLVPNPIDVAEFRTPPVRGRFRARLRISGPLVLFLGRITPRKRLDVLVSAFAGLGPAEAGHYVRSHDVRSHDARSNGARSNGTRSNATLVIAGNDAGAAGPARRLARDLGIGDRTVFTGLLRGPERLEALADADVVVYASEDEIFGLVPLEALLSGTPVIVADDSGCAEVVRSVGGGMIVPLGDADTLARAIADVLEKPDDWRAAAAEAACRVRTAYASDVVCAQVDGVYQEVVDSAQRHPRLMKSVRPSALETV